MFLHVSGWTFPCRLSDRLSDVSNYRTARVPSNFRKWQLWMETFVSRGGKDRLLEFSLDYSGLTATRLSRDIVLDLRTRYLGARHFSLKICALVVRRGHDTSSGRLRNSLPPEALIFNATKRPSMRTSSLMFAHRHRVPLQCKFPAQNTENVTPLCVD